MGKFIRHSRTWPPPRAAGHSVDELAFSDPQCLELPARPRVQGTLGLRGMKRLTEIPGLLFGGHSLILTGCPALRRLPPVLRPLRLLVLDGVGIESLPDDLPFAENAELTVQNCSRLRNLPAAVSSGSLAKITIRNCPRLIPLPALAASQSITLTRWRGRILETPLRAPSLGITRCPDLERIAGPWGGRRVHLADCPELLTFAPPEEEMEQLLLEHCEALTALPEGLKFHGRPAELILRGCPALTAFPENLSAREAGLPPLPAESTLPLPLPPRPDGRHALPPRQPPPRPQPVPEVPGSLIVEAEPCPAGGLPPWSFPWRLRVRRVLLEPAAVLNPEGINPLLVLTHSNSEVRRVLLENLGMERLEASMSHTLLDADTDAGGLRRLIRFQLPLSAFQSPSRPSSPAQSMGEKTGNLLMRIFGRADRNGGSAVQRSGSEPPPPSNTRPAGFLDCRCPSTGRRYLLPVPPSIQSCHAAAAWMAGFEHADDYAPLLET